VTRSYVGSGVKKPPKKTPRLVSLTSAMQKLITFGGMDINKIKATAKLLRFECTGDYFKIREHVAARSKRKYPKVPPTTYADLECVVVDMISFKVKSIDGALYSHNFKDKNSSLAWTFPVRDAGADTFLKVLLTFLAVNTRFKIGIIRADAGSNYTAPRVRTFLEHRKIKLEICIIAAPHQIGLAERNHGVLLPTVRALMAFANAPYRLWACCLRWTCMLHNVSAVDYKTQPRIPFHILDKSIDNNLLIPFGCLVTIHRDKSQVHDGKLDPRGVFGAFIGLADQFSFKKGIKVYTRNNVIIETCFFSYDDTLYPWRPAGQRRLLSDGTFGQEIETNDIFKTESIFDENELFVKDDMALFDANFNAVLEPKPVLSPILDVPLLPTLRDASTTSQTSSDDEVSIASVTLPEEI
jgi:hypothetical protein